VNPQTRFFARHLLPVIVVAGVILALGRTGMDPLVSHWFFDTKTSGFPLRYNGFVEVALHHGAKYLVVLVAVAAIAGYLISFLSPPLKPARNLYLFTALSLTLAPLTVAILKFFSMRHCPWDVAGFGGFVPYIGLLDTYPAGIAAGRCFPAGHASTGFCLFAFYFVGRALGRPPLAYAGFALGLVAGLGLGLVRIMQGAHFATHVLWSGVVCWIVIVVLYGLIIESRRAPDAQSNRELSSA
jgi:membrane-associated PAP2 superfamily phosphatase